ncbi:MULTISPECIES: ArsC/Spx/MgsR family protein [Loigolactobacillus]|uniref:Transcriptional regulator Spx n=1 Tax=Loigolactobacillus backii TaxID=375175 RepID=A0A192H0X8_9LACO|nr:MULTISPECIES: ArsC/Spx/MgsR family protein [Loigolactobacillus]ANK60535.1 transcriptional regulator Spx [Loigolactobacillus backii]ANK61897.1 transcriptional regulator Spx [Loigolactobacillus backii]ANK65486.1 transcriptional regulator Spx [Loigolactobacillus backii]ANK67960.1 transcriptional regulator Spx [Loigolactobacillus backii]ANK68909.1 transcriptional regulator Spx [Loigolactobacillus backii]
MITMYFHTSDPAKNKLMKWFKQQHLEFKLRNIIQKPLTKAELTHLFLMATGGTDDLIAKKSKVAKSTQLDNNLTFNELIDTVLATPQLLKNPVVFDDKNIVAGYSLEKIGVFIPKSQRKLELMALFNRIYPKGPTQSLSF